MWESRYFNATALQGGAGSLWVCEGPCDALALRTAGVPPVVAIFGVQGCWGLGGRLVVGEPSRRGAFAAIPAPVRAQGARVNHRMSNPSRRSFSGEPVKLTSSSQVRPLAKRSGVLRV